MPKKQVKQFCPWSKTYFAWAKWDEKMQKYICTCKPCKAPKKGELISNIK